MTDMISDSAKRLFAQYPAVPESRDGAWNAALWQAVDEAGFPLALLSEEEGGFSLEPADACTLLHIAAAHAVTIPLGETMVANWLLAKAGLEPAEGPAGVAARTLATGIACGRYLRTLVLYEPEGDSLRLVRLDVSDAGEVWKQGSNITGEPRDTFLGDATTATGFGFVPVGAEAINALMALVRSQQMAGALQAILDRTVQYATERVQFGKPLGKFQAIQQYLAIMAGETAAARAAALMAAQALSMVQSEPDVFRLTVAAAKIRVGEAAGTVCALSHQIHGAIGFSREYALHPLTRRLWAWRDEHGREADWASELGKSIISGKAGVWPQITNLQASFF
ncbi:hypothetical protein ACO34A_24040 (plasmid) [Rhizobium sp. ACO-34A]|nr:acyl-CoA dehydrogenase [Rhizobium sp. ACO-34A]ATN36851.1 hypothetical protein ACO34A_24040 [Rhizobium sp. ACO-34A]